MNHQIIYITFVKPVLG